MALFWIIASVIAISGSSYMTVLASSMKKKKQIMNEKVVIRTLVQTSSLRESLPSDFLAQLLGLSEDYPATLHSFSLSSARMRLENFCLIKKAEVKKLKEGGVYVDYELREPIVWLGDFSNAALDKEGVIIPYYPFFSPKNMTEVYLDLKKRDQADLTWGSYLTSPEFTAALDMIKTFEQIDKEEGVLLEKVDVSALYSSSFGAREIVVVVSDKLYQDKKEPHSFRWYLRMPVKNYAKAFANFFVLREEMKKQSSTFNTQEKIVDLRLSQLAFLEETAQ